MENAIVKRFPACRNVHLHAISCIFQYGNVIKINRKCCRNPDFQTIPQFCLILQNVKFFSNGRRADPQVSGPHNPAQLPAQLPTQLVWEEGGNSSGKMNVSSLKTDRRLAPRCRARGAHPRATSRPRAGRSRKHFVQ